MSTRSVMASTTNGPARMAAVSAGDPSLLTRTELDAAAGGGGPAGVNPSRNGIRLIA
jgi:hypothetical protein